MSTNEKNWDDLISWHDTMTWNPEEIERSKKAFVFMKTELGVDFLVKAFDEGHPFCMNISNRQTGWGRLWLVWFADALRKMKTQTNYASLLRRLKDKASYPEALSVLQIAYDFQINGFEITFDPKITVGKNVKKPDLRLINRINQEEVYVEVSMMGTPLGSQVAGDQMDKIYFAHWGKNPHVHVTGRLLKILSPAHFEEIMQAIQNLYQKCIEEQKLQELIEDDVIEFAIAPDDKHEDIGKWARDKGLTAAFEGPGVDINMMAKTRQRIDTEQEQLPTDKAGILVISSHEFFFRTRDNASAINELEETVYSHPQLFALLVIGQHIGGEGQERFSKHGHQYHKDTWMSMGAEHRLIIENRFCKIKVDDSTKLKLSKGLGYLDDV